MKDGEGFAHRIAYGCWINDFRGEPILGEGWPSVRIDRRTTDDFTGLARFLKAAGYTAIDVFGLLTNHDWPMDVASVLSPERRRSVEELVAIAHREGIALIYGLGVYSWGFDSIIAADERVRGTNRSALCGSRPESGRLMERVIDFVLGSFAFDGVHLEAADQGRCRCPACAAETDVDYFNRLNVQTADHIRRKWPGKLLLVNTSGYLPWGDCFAQRDHSSLLRLGQSIDVFIDGGNHGLFLNEREREGFLHGFPCAYGTSGGFWIYPPQRWDRLRWFIPHFQANGAHLKRLHEEGGRACELYMGPLVNPGVEMTVMCNGLLMNGIHRTMTDVLEEAVDRLYRPDGAGSRAALAEIFTRGEEAFFSSWSPRRIQGVPPERTDGIDPIFAWSKTAPERAVPGELFLEPLFGNDAGFPAYLAVHMSGEGRAAYGRTLSRLLEDASRPGIRCRDDGRIERIKACLAGAMRDVEAVSGVMGTGA